MARPVLYEREFMAQVVKLARLCGWLVYHTHDSRRSERGFPDLVLAHPRRRLVWFVELKTDRGDYRPGQREWLEALRQAGAFAQVWRPRDWDSIESMLRGE